MEEDDDDNAFDDAGREVDFLDDDDVSNKQILMVLFYNIYMLPYADDVLHVLRSCIHSFIHEERIASVPCTKQKGYGHAAPGPA